MNMQAMMKQAQKLQKDMGNTKKEIDATEYEETIGNISVKAMGNKKLTSIKINMEKVEDDDIEILEDMILVSVNSILKKIDKDTESRMGKFTQGMPGLF